VRVGRCAPVVELTDARSMTRCGYIKKEANGGSTYMLAMRMVGLYRHRMPPSPSGILASRYR
jgi:hypothetical protein